MTELAELTRTTVSRPDRLRSMLSRAICVLALLVLAGDFLLISPPRDQTYPGAVPWRPGSWLQVVINAMSLGGAVSTARGVEIKDLVLYGGAVAGLLLLAVRAVVSGFAPAGRRTSKGPWFFGQVFLVLWAGCSLLSAAWSGDAQLSLGQGTIYALTLAWAVALAWTLDGRDIPLLLWGYVAIAAVGAALTVWYFHERNPYHRPGFPIGNPGPLAACILPAVILAGCGLGQALSGFRTRSITWLRVGLCAAALIPLLWCLWLAGSRSGLVGGFAAGLTILFLHVRRRTRWIVAIAGVLCVATMLIWYGQSAQELAMARGATIRFRLYAWRYAAHLWSMRSITGHGAAAYPRYADQLSVGDRMIDPGAFMGENIGHAHNELFEVFTELGLVLGVFFVAGHVATILAGFALIRANLSPQRRWLLTGLVAAVVGLLADSMFGVGLRLPGMPAVFFTLLGVLWAACRSVSREAGPVLDSPAARSAAMARRYGVAAICLIAAAFALNATLRNWIGVLAEQSAISAAGRGQLEFALAETRHAEGLLLDPIRALAAHDRGVELELRLARAAFDRWRKAWTAGEGADTGQPPSTAATLENDDWQRAIALAEQTIRSADQLRARAPAFGHSALFKARAAELLVQLYRDVAPEQARRWMMEAWSAWRSRQEQRPYELQTLFALCRYPDQPQRLVELLRNSLRAPSSETDWFPPPRWYDLLEEFAGRPEFPQALAVLALNAGPFDPKTDLNVLVLSFAPETHRLVAAWLAMNRDFAAAEIEAGRAVALYQPMRSRFPELYSVALAEQAEYAFQSQPGRPEHAIELARAAIEALPRIQAQKYAALTAPFRERLARYLLAAGREREAAELLKQPAPASAPADSEDPP